ncbi:MAG: acyl-CoA dehydrogenase family protein [Candidatus Nanopelagicales bacterium]
MKQPPATLDAVDDVARELLEPTAADSDVNGLPRGHLEALAAAGAYRAAFPPTVGGTAESANTNRMTIERIAGACGTTWFCFAQHRSPTVELIASDNQAMRDRWLRPMVTGEALASIAFAHLRRPKQNFTMTRVADGWRLDGKLDWVTGWPITDVCLVQGLVAQGLETATDFGGEARVISALIEPPRPNPAVAPGLIAGPTLPLAAMGGTHSWPIRFDGYHVPDGQVTSIRTLSQWKLANDRVAANANPAVFGMAQDSVDELRAVADQTGSDDVLRASRTIGDQLSGVRAQAYDLADAAAASDEVADESIFERTRLRAYVLDLNLRAATALLAAQGGSSMLLSAKAQRRAREALFLHVQGQTRELRSESLRIAATDGVMGE